MALTQERLREARSPSTEQERTIPKATSTTLMVAWAVLLPLALFLEPAPAADAATPWWAHILSNALLAAIATTFVGLAQRKQWGPTASFVASSFFVAGVFACPASGHHAFGLWWFGEFAAALALVGLSGAAYLKSRR